MSAKVSWSNVRTRATATQMAGRVLAILTVASSVSSAPFAYAELPESAEPIVPTRLARVEIVLGRLQLSPRKFKVGKQHEQMEETNRVRSVCVSMHESVPTLQLLDKCPTQRCEVSFQSSGEVRWSVENLSTAEPRRITYEQLAQGPIRIEVVTSEGQVQRCQSESIWHLMLQQPEVFRKYVQPFLLRLAPAWNLDSTLAETLRVMRSRVHDDATGQRVAKLIEELGSGEARTRSLAEGELLKVGLAARIPLKRYDSSSTKHQRLLMRRILRGIAPSGDDTSIRLAHWLSGDQAVSDMICRAAPDNVVR